MTKNERGIRTFKFGYPRLTLKEGSLALPIFSVSWETGRQEGVEGSDRLAIMGELLFSLAGSFVQEWTLEREK